MTANKLEDALRLIDDSARVQAYWNQNTVCVTMKGEATFYTNVFSAYTEYRFALEYVIESEKNTLVREFKKNIVRKVILATTNLVFAEVRWVRYS